MIIWQKLYLLNLYIQSNLDEKYSHRDWFMKADTDSYIRMDAIKLWLARARDSCVNQHQSKSSFIHWTCIWKEFELT